MSDKYTLVQEGLDQWISSPNNGGECCQTNAETVDELNRLLARIKRLERAGDGMACWVLPAYATDPANIALKMWKAAKEDRP